MEGPFTIVEHVGHLFIMSWSVLISRNVSVDCNLQDKAKKE